MHRKPHRRFDLTPCAASKGAYLESWRAAPKLHTSQGETTLPNSIAIWLLDVDDATLIFEYLNTNWDWIYGGDLDSSQPHVIHFSTALDSSGAMTRHSDLR